MRKGIVLAVAVVSLAVVVGFAVHSIANAECDDCYKTAPCVGAGCPFLEICLPALSSLSVVTDQPDPFGYTQSLFPCGRCWGIGGQGGLCGPGMASSACSQ